MLEVCGLVLLTSFVMELISWAIIWRPDWSKQLTKEAEACYKRLEPTMRYRGEGDKTSKKKDGGRMDPQFMKISQSMIRVKLLSAALSYIPLIVLYRVLNPIYKGRVAAILPFTPISFFHRTTHSGLEGTDFSQASAMFIYYLAGFGIRGNVSKIFSFGPPRHLNDFFAPQKVAEQAEQSKKKTN